jgi:hypothetical protein
MFRRNLFSRSGAAVLDRPYQMPRFNALRSAIFGPTQILQLGPVAWFRFNSAITVGTGVAQWGDQSGNGNTLKQASATFQPALQGDGSILFDGISHTMKCVPFAFKQPESIYILFRQVTWTVNHYIFDGDAANSGRVIQSAVTPALTANAGASLAADAELAVNTYGVLTTVFNGAASSMQVNFGTLVTGAGGALDMAGFSLGSAGSGGLPSNIQVKEVILFPVVHDAQTRARIILYLGKLGGIF